MDTLSYVSLGGTGIVTKNMHVYELGQEILIIDCGLGFADESMMGVDLLLPDISYLLDAVHRGKRIVGMVITHGHEDHMGGLPYLLPQLPSFPIFAPSFATRLANAKLQEFQLKPSVKEAPFGQEIRLGSFTCTPIQVTHSIPDTAHVFIKTPIGNFYHGSDFKFDLTPWDGRKTDFQAIVKAGLSGIRCLMSECLGAERPGFTPSESDLTEHFEKEIQNMKGRLVITTYSSHVARLNQIISLAEKYHKYVAFIGRSLIKTKELAEKEGLLVIKKGTEVQPDQLKRYQPKDLILFVAGSQGQENSALTRMINAEHRLVELLPNDTVIFSADPIPGNEISVYAAIDELAHRGIRVLYSSGLHEYHVSGHGSGHELLLLLQMLKPKQLLPISGNYRHMTAYKALALQDGYNPQDVILPENGQQILFGVNKTTFGQKVPLKHVYVDEVSGEEVEQFVLRDRQKISQDGIVAIIAEFDADEGILVGKPEVVSRGVSAKEASDIDREVTQALKTTFAHNKRVNDWGYLRKQIRETAERKIYQVLKRNPLIMPVVIEV